MMQVSIDWRGMSRKKTLHALCFAALTIMDFQLKVFSWPDRGNHLIMIIRGVMDAGGFAEIAREVAKATQSLQDCKVLIDLQDTTCSFETKALQTLVDGLKPDLWPPSNRVAIVSPREIEQYEQLMMLTSGLSKRGFKSAVFYDSAAGINWLANNV
jgi:hypothetical protein